MRLNLVLSRAWCRYFVTNCQNNVSIHTDVPYVCHRQKKIYIDLKNYGEIEITSLQKIIITSARSTKYI